MRIPAYTNSPNSTLTQSTPPPSLIPGLPKNKQTPFPFRNHHEMIRHLHILIRLLTRQTHVESLHNSRGGELEFHSRHRSSDACAVAFAPDEHVLAHCFCAALGIEPAGGREGVWGGEYGGVALGGEGLGGDDCLLGVVNYVPLFDYVVFSQE